jgi:hypothetical protein
MMTDRQQQQQVNVVAVVSIVVLCYQQTIQDQGMLVVSI